MSLYSGPGQRRVLPPLVFGAGVLWHLLRHGRRYDVVHTASFPYFSLLAAAVARWLHRFELVVDWHELWTRDYWRGYLGPVGGRIGWAVQQAVRAGAPAGVLLRPGDGGTAARGGRPRRGHRARGPVHRRAGATGAAARRARRRVRRAAHPGEGGARRRGGDRGGAGAGPRAARGDLRRGARAAAADGRGSRRPDSSTTRSSSARWRGRCACCTRRGARATGRSSWRRRRSACRRCSSTIPTTPRSS